ncbi:MAG: diacylglycerol kinase family protein [Bryobacteraceae bacterium]
MTLYRQPVLIYNPTAGKVQRNSGRLIERTTEALARANIVPELLPTAAAGHATVLAREAIAAGADLVLVLGGDGTINEVANGMVNSSVPLGVLPGGTANVLAMELGLGSSPERAARQLERCVERKISLGKMTRSDGTSRYFLLMGGVGLDAAIVNAVDPALKAKTGKLAYWVAGLGRFTQTIEQFTAKVAGVEKQCGFVLAARVRNYGGDLEIAKGASLLADAFEVVLFEGSHPLRYAGYMLAVGVRCVQVLPGVQTVRATEMEFSGEAPVQIDGEAVGSLPVRFEIVPSALTLLVPPRYK